MHCLPRSYTHVAERPPASIACLGVSRGTPRSPSCHGVSKATPFRVSERSTREHSGSSANAVLAPDRLVTAHDVPQRSEDADAQATQLWQDIEDMYRITSELERLATDPLDETDADHPVNASGRQQQTQEWQEDIQDDASLQARRDNSAASTAVQFSALQHGSLQAKSKRHVRATRAARHLHGAQHVTTNGLDDLSWRSKITRASDTMGSILLRLANEDLLTNEEEANLARMTKTFNVLDGRAVQLRHALHRKPNMTELAAVLHLPERGLLHMFILGRLAKALLVARNIRLVLYIAKRYQSQGVPLPDLIQAGISGLSLAINKYDLSRGYRLSTYATWWITQSIQRSIEQEKGIIRLPSHTQASLQKLNRIQRELLASLQREPSVAELAEVSGLSESEVQLLLQSQQQASSPLSLEAAVDFRRNKESSNPSMLLDKVGDDESDEALGTAQALLQAADLEILLSQFEGRDATIMHARFGSLSSRRNGTLNNLGDALGVTKERVRQLEARAVQKLRNAHRADQLGLLSGAELLKTKHRGQKPLAAKPTKQARQ